MYTRHVDVHMYIVAYVRSMGCGMKGYPLVTEKNPRIPFARKFGEPAGMLATNYARVGYALFTHRKCECAQYRRAGFAFKGI